MDFRKHLLLMVFLAGVGMMFSQGCSFQSGYEKYSSKDSELGVEIDYMSGWVFTESRGSGGSYAQVMFLEPIRKGKPLRAMMALTTQRLSKIDFKPANLEGFAEDLISKRLKLKDAKLVNRSEAEFLGTKAVVVDFSYSLPDNPESLDAQFVTMAERVIALLKGNCFYILRYVNTAQDSHVFEKPFMRCVQSLKYKQ